MTRSFIRPSAQIAEPSGELGIEILVRKGVRRWISMGLWTACVAAQTGPARAAEPTDADRATARALAEEGKIGLDRFDYGLAEDRFARADALVHAPTLMLGLARAQAGLGKLVEAHETYRRILREGIRPGSPPAFARALEDASKEVGGIAGRLAWVTISVTPSSGAALVLDGTAIPTAAVGARRPVNPGQHRVRAMAPGYMARDEIFSVNEGQGMDFTLALSPAPGAELPGTIKGPEPPRPAVGGGPIETERDGERRGDGAKAAGAMAFVLGASGLATGAVAGGFAMRKHAQLERACPGGVCRPESQSDIDDFRTLSTVSTIGFVVGGVGVSAGLVLLLVAPSSEPSPRVTAYVGPDAAGLRGQF
jgi:hypothetical protein